jgi:hypothetical protein
LQGKTLSLIIVYPERGISGWSFQRIAISAQIIELASTYYSNLCATPNIFKLLLFIGFIAGRILHQAKK